ncbi:MAG TPA: hypothetical protein ENJ80_02305 [Gammaproteobacteria bacterium]|nr:hypothetical protein [Gammaproteobacteria bacterium]
MRATGVIGNIRARLHPNTQPLALALEVRPVGQIEIQSTRTAIVWRGNARLNKSTTVQKHSISGAYDTEGSAPPIVHWRQFLCWRTAAHIVLKKILCWGLKPVPGLSSLIPLNAELTCFKVPEGLVAALSGSVKKVKYNGVEMETNGQG